MHPIETPLSMPVNRHCRIPSKVTVLISDRPIAAVLAALATPAIVALIDFLISYVAG